MEDDRLSLSNWADLLTQYENGGEQKLLPEQELVLIKGILDYVPALIHIRDQTTGAIVWCNAAWEHNLQIPRQQIIAESEEILKKIVHPDDFSLLKISNEYYRHKNMSNFGGIIRVCFPQQKEWQWLVGISRVIRTDSRGIPLETLAVFQDFTQAIHTESQIREALHDVLRIRYSDVLHKITNREKQVIHLLAKGFSNAQIARQLYISHHTVESHRKNIRMKLNVRNTSELISLIKDLGI